MKIYNLAIFATVAAFGLTGCTPSANNTTVNVNRTNTNAVVTNTNSANTVTTANTSGVNTNSNMNSTGANKVSAADEEFMKKAAQGGLMEVRLGETVKEKGQGADAKGFAEKMVTDHSKANDELKALAASKGVTLPTEPSAEQKAMIEKLSKLSGAALDKEYIKDMVTDHEKDVAEFDKQSKEAVDADVKAFAAKTLPVLKMHLDMVKEINAKMK